MNKSYSLNKRGDAVFENTYFCPICDQGIELDEHKCYYAPPGWCRSFLLCGHGYQTSENIGTNSRPNWFYTITIYKRYIPKLKAMGYKQK